MNFHFRGGQQAAVARLLDHHLQFFGGARLACDRAAPITPSARTIFSAKLSSKLDRPAECVQKPVKRPRDQQRHAFGARQAQVFGTSSPSTTCRIVSRRKGDEPARCRARSPPPTDARIDRTSGVRNPCERDFAEIAERQAGERDADLHAGNHAARSPAAIPPLPRGRRLLRPVGARANAGPPPEKIPWRRKRRSRPPAQTPRRGEVRS